VLMAASCTALQLPVARPSRRLRAITMVDAEAGASSASAGAAAGSSDESSSAKVKVKVRVRSKKERTSSAADRAATPVVDEAELDSMTTTTVTVKEKADFSTPVPQEPQKTGMGSEGAKLTEDEEQLLAAVQKANCSRILTALQTGVNPNVRDPKGRTPLHFVAGVGLAPAAVLLLHYGAEPNVRDEEMLTPLHMATGYTNAQTCRVLIAGGADSTLKGKQQGTPMDVAIALGDYTLKQFMERSGTDKLKKKDDKLEEIKEVVSVLEDPDQVRKDADWDEMLLEVMKTIAQEESA